MISRDAARATALTVVVAAIGGALLWWDAQRAVDVPAADEPVSTRQPAAEPPARGAQPPEAVREDRRAAPQASGLYRCEQGGATTYQAHPCAPGAVQKELSGGSLSVVDAPPRTLGATTATLPRNKPAAAQSESRVGLIRMEPTPSRDIRCQSLLEAIERVDARGRLPNTARSVERLRTERREYVEEMHALACPKLTRR